VLGDTPEFGDEPQLRHLQLERYRDILPRLEIDEADKRSLELAGV
jgi:hypothetical protein